ncbi:MAG TPA: glycosyltransferase family 4 protein [Tepidisphaeraceae bacterium]|jgi:colanic acid biosynthesis glycosyl transferase WcaI|nr:glycosyltransferase family 4 protein [Tepidisphaeraceae bacterium]
MRLTLINQFYVPDLSPTAHLCASLAEHRAALGDRVTVVTGRAGYLGAMGQATDDGLVDVRRIWTTQLGSRTKARRFIDWITFYISALKEAASLPPQEVVIAMTTPPFIAWAGALHKMLNPRTRLILWNMDCWPDTAERLNMIRTGGLASRALRGVNRALLQMVDHVVCLDQAMANLLLSQYAPRGRALPWSIIPNWERASLFPRQNLGDRWSSPVTDRLNGRFVVLYLGNAGYGHEFQTMIDAAQELHDEPITFLFVGGGSQFDWIREQIRSHGLTNIVLHDYVPKPQTPGVMRSANCALITLEDYAMGVMSPSKLHANLAMGLPVIYVGPAGGNVHEALDRFGCGVSIRSGQTDTLVSALRGLSNNEVMQNELRSRARRAFEQAYCDTQTLPQFDAVLDFATRREGQATAEPHVPPPQISVRGERRTPRPPV